MNVVGYRYIVIDHDSNKELQFKIIPTAIIKTKNGYHYYFKIIKSDIHLIEELEDLAKKLAKLYKSDPSSGERNRAYRCAGFLHNKVASDLHLVETIFTSNSEYSLEDFVVAYNNELKNIELGKNDLRKNSFEEWYEAQPFHEGIRNTTLYSICSYAFNVGMTSDRVQFYVDDYVSKSFLPKAEAYEVFQKVLKKNESLATDIKPKIFDVAQKFIDSKFLNIQKQLLLRYFSGDFYCYKEGAYRIIDHEEFKAMVTNFIHSFKKLHDVSIKKYREDVIATIQSKCFAPIDLGKSFWLNGEDRKDTYICLRNGLLNLDKYLEGNENCLIEHTPHYFTTNQLPFDFKIGSSCSTWLNFLNNIFDDKEIVTLLQCWFGYNLIPDTSQHKFMILYGKGANGKSVVTIILTALLGEENVSSLGLECFDQSRTFSLNGLINKLANIVSEMNEVPKTSEGLLKSIVCGEAITIDRKYREPISYRPKARLTFATNVLPRIADRSDGISRRLILIPFEKQMLDEKKQDKRLSNLDFWIESGELSGVFIWALEGLKHLRKSGSFKIPKKVQDSIDNYIIQSNPTFEYLITHYRYSKDQKESKNRTYSHYENWMANNGFTKLNANNFANEVRRAFALVESTTNYHTFQNRYAPGTFRDRAWLGLSMKKDDEEDHIDQFY